jgi:hypothetical protein
MYNPLDIAGANRHRGHNPNRPRARRTRVGAEFKYCPDGSQVQFDEACPGTPYTPLRPGGTRPITTGTPVTSTPPNWGPGTPYNPGIPPNISTVPYNPGGTPPVISTVPYNPECPPGSCAPQIPVCPENQKRWTLPFVPDTGFTEVVAAGATVRFVAFPQGLFIGERLIVPSTIGPYFNIVDFRIANKPQTMASGEVPADMYSEVSTLDTMKYDQAYPGIQVVLTARNKSAISQTFQCSLSGWAIG